MGSNVLGNRDANFPLEYTTCKSVLYALTQDGPSKCSVGDHIQELRPRQGTILSYKTASQVGFISIAREDSSTISVKTSRHDTA